MAAFAKGGFSFITITGPKIEREIRSDDSSLTEDFFAFADFYRNKTSTPVDPGIGYEITRYYIEGKGELAFDRLHYYPETGFVYYDGITGGGSSEYDGEWYTAKPEIKTSFESALSSRSMSQIQSSASTVSTRHTQPRWSSPPFSLILLVTLGIAVILLFTYRLRRIFTQ
jgi:hypothetical protein